MAGAGYRDHKMLRGVREPSVGSKDLTGSAGCLWRLPNPGPHILQAMSLSRKTTGIGMGVLASRAIPS